MKRMFVPLGILGLAWAVAHPAAAQTVKVLWQPDLTKGNPLKGAAPTDPPFRQGVNSSGDQSTNTTPATAGAAQSAPFQIITDTSDTRVNWLDGGDSSNIGQGDLGSGNGDTDASSPTAMYMMLTGDPTWTDVTLTSKVVMWNQNTGAMALVLRAAPKAKVTDPDSYYMLQLTTGNSDVLASMARDGITQPNDTSTNDDGSSEGCTLRILKRVKGKWTQLAEVNQDKTSVHIPRINNLGHDHDVNHGQGAPTTDALVGGYFQFVAKGNALTGNVSLDGKTFTKVIEATDTGADALKAGLIGFNSYDIEPCFKEITVTTP